MADHRKSWWLQVHYIASDGVRFDEFAVRDKAAGHKRFRAFASRANVLDVTLWQGSKRILRSAAEAPYAQE
jgi:hypothetical protein